MLKLLNTLTVGGKTFTEADRVNTLTAEHLELPDDWYGGNAKKLTYMQTVEGFYICVNRKGNLVNLAYDPDALTDEGKKLLEVDKDGKTKTGNGNEIQEIDEGTGSKRGRKS